MNDKKRRHDAYFADKPDWYWAYGLHDATVKAVHPLLLPPDWKSDTPKWNCLELDLDAKGALFDTSVQKILLYNYKILSGSLLDFQKSNIWWISDTLTCGEDGYTLDIRLESAHSDRFSLRVLFQSATVERKK